MEPQQPTAEPNPAPLYGGPADGLTIPPGREIEYVAVTVDPAGRRIPDTTDDGTAVTLPDEQGPATEALLSAPGRKWECYRRVGTYPAGYDALPSDDLPLPPDGQTAYRWVCRRPQS